jgi:hypothetical protein
MGTSLLTPTWWIWILVALFMGFMAILSESYGDN